MKYKCHAVDNTLRWNASGALVDVYFDGQFALTTSDGFCDLPSTYTPTTFSVIDHCSAYDVAPIISEIGDGDQARIKFATKPLVPYAVKNGTGEVLATVDAPAYIREYVMIGEGLVYMEGQPEHPEAVTISATATSLTVGGNTSDSCASYNGVLVTVVSRPTSSATVTYHMTYADSVTTQALPFGQNSLTVETQDGVAFATPTVGIPFQDLIASATYAQPVLSVDFSDDSRVANVEVYTNLNPTLNTLEDTVIFDSPYAVATEDAADIAIPSTTPSGRFLVVLRAFDANGYSNASYTTYVFDHVAESDGIGTIGITDASSTGETLTVRVDYTPFAGAHDVSVYIQVTVGSVMYTKNFAGTGIYEFLSVASPDGWHDIEVSVADGDEVMRSNTVTLPVYFYSPTITTIASEASPC